MPQFDFGKPPGDLGGGLIQTAYVVRDIEASMAEFTRRLGIGPWFVTGPFVPAEGVYRGSPTKMRLTLAVGFHGSMSFELIEQHDDLPSVYQEVIKSRGYGFHHWGVAVPDLEGAIADYRARGYEVAFADRAPRGYRVAYMDTSRDLPGMIELLELTPALAARYNDIHAASVGWDGRDPIRRT